MLFFENFKHFAKLYEMYVFRLPYLVVKFYGLYVTSKLFSKNSASLSDNLLIISRSSTEHYYYSTFSQAVLFLLQYPYTARGLLICHKLSELCYCFKGFLFKNGFVAVYVIDEFGLTYHIADIDRLPSPDVFSRNSFILPLSSMSRTPNLLSGVVSRHCYQLSVFFMELDKLGYIYIGNTIALSA